MKTAMVEISRKIVFSLSHLSYTFPLHIMSNGEVRCSQSANFFNTIKKQKERKAAEIRTRQNEETPAILNNQKVNSTLNKLKSFSISRMEEIVKIYDKIMEMNKVKRVNCERMLKPSLKRKNLSKLKK